MSDRTRPATPAARYASTRVMRRTAAFELLSALRDDHVPVTLVRPVGRGGPATEAALDRVVEAHAAVAHPRIAAARLVRLGSGRSLAVELAAPATTDGAEIVRRMIAARTPLSYAQADAFVAELREVLALAHETRDGRGRPRTLGRLGFGNVLVAEDGRWWLVGLGHNVPNERHDGALATDEALFVAPEVALGVPPTPSSDFVATLMLKRALAHLVEVPDAIRRAFADGADPEARRLAELIFWFERAVASELPARRPSLAEIHARVREMADLVGAGRDAEGFERVVAQHADPLNRLHPRSMPSLEVAHDGAWARLGGAEPLRLGGATGRVLAALAATGERPVTTADLAAAGWPGERMVARAASNRVYVALHKLRALGLGPHIQRTPAGYQLTGVAPRLA